MKYLVMIIMLFTLVMVVRADHNETVEGLFTPDPLSTSYVTLDNGMVITIPLGGASCRFHKNYCILGWMDDGQFPGVRLRNMILRQLADGVTVLDHPLCPEDGIDFSPAQLCYRLVSSDSY